MIKFLDGLAEGMEGKGRQAKIVIRAMRPEDAPRMHEIHTQCVKWLCSAFYDADQVGAWLGGRLPDVYNRAVSVRGERMQVAESEGRVVGFASWKDNELCNLFVHPDAGGKGIGAALFQACADDARKEGHELSKVDATLNSKSFYEKLGFAEEERSARRMRGVDVPVVSMRLRPKAC